MNKRGSIMDAFPILNAVAYFAIIAVLMVLVLNVFNNSIQADGAIPQVAKDILQSGAEDMPAMFNFWFLVMFIGLPMVSAVLAYFNNIHPFFFWVSLLFVVAVLMVGQAIKLVWEGFISDAAIASVAQSMPALNTIMSNYGFYSFFVFIIIASGTFIKLRGGVRTDVYGGI